MLYFTATEVQALRLLTSLRILYSSMIDYEVILLLWATWDIFTVQYQQQTIQLFYFQRSVFCKAIVS